MQKQVTKRQVQIIQPTINTGFMQSTLTPVVKKRVAAYARVSTGTIALHGQRWYGSHAAVTITFDPRWMQRPTTIDYRLTITGLLLAVIIFRADHPTALPGSTVLRAQHLAPQCSTIFALQFLFV